ncbi:MAG: hypothetical protein WEB63_04070 [Cucumibacter sp.]
MGPLGQHIGIRTTVTTFAEVVFKGTNHQGDRPDALIVLNTGRSSWKALVEVKHGKAELLLDQVQRYVELAKDFDISAVITISNQFTALPTHSPVTLSGALTKSVSLFHLSWSAIKTEVELLQTDETVSDPERRLVMVELHRYLSHESAGISGFTQMNSGWKEVTKALARAN